MQTVEFNERLTKILETLQIEKILVAVKSVLFTQGVANQTLQLRKEFASLVFAAKSNLQALSNDSTNNEIITLLGINQAFDSESLGQMITGLNTLGYIHEVANNNQYYRLFYQLFSALTNLARFQQTVQKILIGPHTTVVSEGESALEFEIIDVGNRGIGMDRFEAVLKTVHILHDSVSRAIGINGRLAVAYLDSGSNSIVSIKSDHRIITEIRKLIGEVWDKIKFGKFDKMERKLEAAEAGINFIIMVGEKEKDGKLDSDTAAKLKHLAISETIELFGKGASLREIQKQTILDNQSLLLDKFDIKLIEDGPNSSAESKSST